MSYVVWGIAQFLALLLAVVVIAKLLVDASHRRAQKPAPDPGPLPQEAEKGTLASLQQLIQAQPGSFWIITRATDETEHVWHEIFVRGDEMRMEQLGALLKEGLLTAFDRANPQHKRVLLAVLHGANGIMAHLAREEEIGWGGAEILRQCVRWGIVPQNQLLNLYQSTAAAAPRQPGSRDTEVGLKRLQLILSEVATPSRRDSQFLKVGNV